jgi:F-type H+-transporting ATPase subunit epsilon
VPGIKVEIITPEKRVFSADADFLTVPAYAGEMGILPGHAPLVAQLLQGNIRVTTGATIQKLAITGGVMSVSPSKVAVFAKSAQLWLNGKG